MKRVRCLSQSTARLSPSIFARSLSITLSLAIGWAPVAGAGGIVTDGSVGSIPGGSLSGPDFEITEAHGTLRGTNLFHSFSRFDLDASESALFSGLSPIENVISRFTGNSAPNIDGAISSSIAGANFYFLSPRGIVFGENASINVGGSLHVSTADQLDFSDGRFAATNPFQTGNTALSAAPPQAWGFLSGAHGRLEVADNATLEVSGNARLSLVATDLRVGAGALLQAESGAIDLVSVRGGQVELSSGAPLPTGGTGAGPGNLVLDGATVQSETLTANGSSGAVRLNAAGTMTLLGATIQSLGRTSGVDAGSLRIEGGQLVIGSGSEITTRVTGDAGNAGDIEIDVDTLDMRASLVASDTLDDAGNAGDIRIRAESATVSSIKAGDGRAIASRASDRAGNAGRIEIDVTDALELRGTNIQSLVDGSAGNSGGVEIVGRTLEAVNSVVESRSEGLSGAAGSLRIAMSESMRLENDSMTVIANSQGDPTGLVVGAVDVSAPQIDMIDGRISANTGGSFDAPITRVVADILTMTTRDPNDPTRFATIASNASQATGNAGRVIIEAGTLSLSNEARIASVAADAGDAGVVEIIAGSVSLAARSLIAAEADVGSRDAGEVMMNISGALTATDSFIRSRSANGSGDAGRVQISAGSVDLVDTVVSSESTGGVGGDVEISASGTLALNRSLITTSAEGNAGAAGDISLAGQDISIRGVFGNGQNESIRSNSTGSGGNAGEINIAAVDGLTLRGTRIFSETSENAGDAGSIDVSARVIDSLNSTIGANSADMAGSAGTIRVSASESMRLTNNSIASVANSLGDPTGRSLGSVEVSAPLIEMIDGRISANTGGTLDGGAVRVTADRLEMSSTSPTDTLFARIASNANLIGGVPAGRSAGSAGDVIVEAASISMRGGAGIVSVAANDAGNAGDVLVTAGELDLDEASFIDTDSSFGSGNAGSIEIAVDDAFTLRNASRISSRARFDSGDAGQITITSSSLALDSSRITTESINGSRSAGRIEISATGGIELVGGSSIVSTTDSVIDPALATTATIAIDSQARLALRDSTITASSSGRIAGGSVLVNVGSVQMRGDSEISSATTGSGQGGLVEIATRSLDMVGGLIDASTEGTGNGGDVRIVGNGTRPAVRLTDSATISARAFGAATAGDVTILSSVATLNRGSRILTSAVSGNGGDITIVADPLIVSSDSLIDAQSEQALDGDVDITSPDVDLAAGLTALSAVFTDPSALLQPQCAARESEDGTFTIARRRGVPTSPEGLLLAFEDLTGDPSNPFASGSSLPAVASAPVGQRDGVIQRGELAFRGGADAFRGGRLEEASTLWTEASEAYSDGGDPARRAVALRGLAQTQLALGQYEESVATLRGVVRYAEEAGDREAAASALSTLGNTYVAVGQPELARKVFLRGLALVSDGANSEAERVLRNNLGNYYAATGDFAEAVATYRATAATAREQGSPLDEARALSNAGRAALDLKDADQARELLEVARAVSKGLPRTHQTLYILIHLGKSYESLARQTYTAGATAMLLESQRLLAAAVELGQELNDPRVLSYALGNLGSLYESEGRDKEALYLTRRALRAAEDARAPESVYRWHWQLGRILRGQGELTAAVHAFDRAVAILEESRQENIAVSGGAELHFRRAVAPVYMDLVDALLATSGELEGAAATSRLVEARSVVERLKAAELRDYFQDECVASQSGKRATLDDVGTDVAVVYPILFQDRLELLVTLPSGLRRYTVPVGALAVRRSANRFREALESPGDAWKSSAKLLHRWLVEPYERDLDREDVKTLVFVPDGVLRTIPMAPLLDRKGAYLGANYSLAVTPGLSVVDPKPLDVEGSRVLIAGVSEAVQGFSALPFVPREAKIVQDILGGQILMDGDFRGDRLESELASFQPSIVHIASHAVFTGNPATTFLLAHDDRISMDDLSRMIGRTRFEGAPIELLMLSACETASGDERAALGLAGVAIRAGARSALGSLWSIADQAAFEIVQEFYTQVKQPGVSKAVALQRAQEKLRQDERFAHPYFWSPFLLISNWL